MVEFMTGFLLRRTPGEPLLMRLLRTFLSCKNTEKGVVEHRWRTGIAFLRYPT